MFAGQSLEVVSKACYDKLSMSNNPAIRFLEVHLICFLLPMMAPRVS